MPEIQSMPPDRRCGAKTRGGGTCTQWPIKGTKRCRMHSGRAGLAGAKAKGAIVMEVRRWGLGDTKVDPTEVMLRLVSQAATRVDLYSSWLEEAVRSADMLRSLGALDEILVAPESRLVFRGENADQIPEHAARQVARQDLERIFMSGSVAALIGHTYSSTKDGDVFATGEAIRGLARLEAEERDRAFRFAKEAVAAGLAERVVRNAEQRGVQMAGVVRQMLTALDLSPEQWARVPGLLQQAVGSITGKIIEGEAAA